MEASYDWCNSIDAGEIVVFTDRDTHQLIGVTGWYPMGSEKAFLRWHGVIDGYRGKGISGIMLEWLMERLVTQYGVMSLYETCNEENHVAYFEKLGFVKVTDRALIDRIALEAGEFKHTLCINTALGKQNPWKAVKSAQDIEMIYSPITGIPISQLAGKEIRFPEGYRLKFNAHWSYNPWTGKERDERDISSDPSGYLIVPHTARNCGRVAETDRGYLCVGDTHAGAWEACPYA
jgi:N-acetylglutamate synthase-like GNAT family acetyltransferase